MSDEKTPIIGHGRGIQGPAEGVTILLDVKLCRRRVLHLEAIIGEFLTAHDASEMSNVEAAIEKLRRAMERV